ncbi:hypothetical protein [Nitrospirillum sp. BR 11163]|uniref:hypothetical protein n=1 Tax=Nitrospirillum sp. BR 11163 TaxID=3104323 RepID=UPI002AFE20A8|nr:hypothetical protein [Nitrospirillum sp. BR 11163]MEA1675476.1 hypothetical protein [Nitrospirillum sp. BR 11163]
MKRFKIAAFLPFLFLIPHASFAQQGAEIIRMDDGVKSTCINYKKDHVVINLRKFILEHEDGWFRADQSVTLYIATRVKIRSQDESPTISLSRSIAVGTTEYDDGLVSAGIEDGLLDDFSLTDGSVSYHSIGLSITLIKEQGASQAVEVIKNLSSLAGTITFPGSGLLQNGYKTASAYVTGALDPLIKGAEKKSEARYNSNIYMSFADSYNCTGDQERTGTKAIVYPRKGYENGDIRKGYINIGDIKNDKFCFKPLLGASYGIKFTTKNNDGTCDDGHYSPLNNPYVMLFVNAAPPVEERAQLQVSALSTTPERDLKMSRTDIASALKTSGMRGDSLKTATDGIDRLSAATQKERESTSAQFRSTGLYYEALKRCEIHNFPAEKCLGR